MAHTLPALPYDAAALEPHIDTQTVQIHHGKHHQAYVTNLNAALDKHPALHDTSLDDLLKNLAAVPEDIRTAVRNNGGGHVGVALALTSVAMLFQPALHRLGRKLRTSSPTSFKGAQPGLTVVAGALLGFLVTLTSVGAGALGVVMLVYLYPYRLTPPRLVGTDIAHAVPLTVVAGLGHWSLGNVDMSLLGALLLGSIPGIVLGSRLSVKVNSVHVRNAIALMLAVVGGKLLLQG